LAAALGCFHWNISAMQRNFWNSDYAPNGLAVESVSYVDEVSKAAIANAAQFA
jgi:hypothetical protein